MNCKKGYSLIEVTISMAILMTVLSGVMLWIVQTTKGHKKITTNEELRKDLHFALEVLDHRIPNSVKLYPPEDLYTLDDEFYHGFVSLDRNLSHLSQMGCRYQKTGDEENFSIFRFTHVTQERPEKTLHLWSDNQAGSANSDDYLRTTYHPFLPDKKSYVFQNFPDYPYKQIYLADADDLVAQRFNIASHTLRLNTNIDPYTNNPDPDKTFTYTTSRLNRPFMADRSTRISAKNLQFVTDSVVYAANTYYVCATNSNQLLLINELAPEQALTLLDAQNYKFDITRFEFRYLALNNTTAFDLDDSILYPTGSDNSECINVVIMQLRLVPQEEDTPFEPLSITKTFYLQNHNLKRPALCNP